MTDESNDKKPEMGNFCRYTLNPSETDPDFAYNFIKDHLMAEGNARLNLATYIQPFMEPQAVNLISENLGKSATYKTFFSRTAEIEDRCVEILAKLWHRPDLPDEPEDNAAEVENNHSIYKVKGTSTVGSSEACMLGGLAMLKRWKDWAKKNHIQLDLTKRPNVIINSGYHICWEKFESFCDVELRCIPLERETFAMDLDKLYDCIDEYTIGVVALLGQTYTGSYDDIQGIDKKVAEYNKKGLNQVHIHVDAAIGGFYEPFINESHEWDFRVDNVISINASGHKYGLVLPGIGWIVWKNGKYLPQQLTYEVAYVGGNVSTVGLNFSKPASFIVAQYYAFVRYGAEGYRKIHKAAYDVSRFVAGKISDISVNINGEMVAVFDLVCENDSLEHRRKAPVVCWKLSDKYAALAKQAGTGWDLTDLSDRLRMCGWHVPAYPLPANLTDVTIQRVVCRADFSIGIAESLLHDVELAVNFLEKKHLKKER